MRMRSTAAGEHPASQGQAPAAPGWAARLLARPGRLPAAAGHARRNWLLTLLLAAGLTLRILTPWRRCSTCSA